MAHRAAQFQSNILLFVLYFVALVPIAGVRWALRSRAASAASGWTPLPAGTDGPEAARQQF